MDRFSKAHPIFQLVFFVLVFTVTLSFYNPFMSAISLIGAFAYIFIIRGRKAIFSLKLVLTIIFFVSLFNMLFAHYGEDVLFTVKDTEFTLQALLYGVNQGVVLGAVMLWFSAFSRVVDSQRVAYALRYMPKTALIFSMVLSFIPRFTSKLDDIRIAKLGLNGGKAPKGVKAKIKDGVDNVSSLVSYSLESSVITSNSMRSRGYNPKSIRPSRYKLKAFDVVLSVLSICLTAYCFYSKISERMLFIFEPKTYVYSFDIYAVICFGVLCLLPSIINFWEVLLWKLSSAKS